MRIIKRVKKNFVPNIFTGFRISPGNIPLTTGTKISNEKPLITSDTVVNRRALITIFCTVICNALFIIKLQIFLSTLL